MPKTFIPPNNHRKWRDPAERLPKEGDIIITFFKGKRNQCIVENGKCHLWRYDITDEIICDVSELECWDGCNGFDF